MATKSYKQLYEETKGMLEKYQDEIVPQLKARLEAQSQTEPQTNITEDELLALKAVAYGCNTNRSLQIINGDATFLERGETDKTVSFKEALVTVYKLIERLKG